MLDHPNPPEFNAAFPALCGQLACPACYGDLHLEADRVGCKKCGRKYPIVDGIPILITGSATET